MALGCSWGRSGALALGKNPVALTLGWLAQQRFSEESRFCSLGHRNYPAATGFRPPWSWEVLTAHRGTELGCLGRQDHAWHSSWHKLPSWHLIRPLNVKTDHLLPEVGLLLFSREVPPSVLPASFFFFCFFFFVLYFTHILTMFPKNLTHNLWKFLFVCTKVL